MRARALMVTRRRVRPWIALLVLVLTSTSAATLPNNKPQSSVDMPCGPARTHGVVVYFVNGVRNSESDAAASCALLRQLLTSHGIANVDLDLFYNRTNADAADACVRGAEEAAATGRTHDLVPWKRVVDPPPPGSGAPLITGATTAAIKTLLVPGEVWRELEGECDQDLDLHEAARQLLRLNQERLGTVEADARRLARRIAAELHAGRRVLVIAHSQGALVAAEALGWTAGPLVGLAADRSRLGVLDIGAPYSLPASSGLGLLTSIRDPADAVGRMGVDATRALEVKGCADALQSERGVSWEAALRLLASPAITVARASCDVLLSALGTSATHPVSVYLQRNGAEIVAVVRQFGGATIAAPDASVGAGGTIILAFDASASMNEHNKLADARAAAGTFLDGLPPTTAVGLMFFGGGCQVSEAVAPTTDKARLKSELASLRATGNTPLARTLREIAEGVRVGRLDVGATVVLVSDGLETCEPPDAALSAARDLGVLLQQQVVR